MVTTTTIYEGDLHCRLIHDPSGASFASDAPKDNQGKGESFSPTDLVGAALGSCLLTVMGIAARGAGVTIEGATARVTKTMAAAPTRRIARLDVAIAIPHAPSPEARAKLEAAALSCPVKQSLHPDIALPIVFHWGAEPA
jgi:putative redox protein